MTGIVGITTFLFLGFAKDTSRIKNMGNNNTVFKTFQNVIKPTHEQLMRKFFHFNFDSNPSFVRILLNMGIFNTVRL